MGTEYAHTPAIAFITIPWASFNHTVGTLRSSTSGGFRKRHRQIVLRNCPKRYELFIRNCLPHAPSEALADTKKAQNTGSSVIPGYTMGSELGAHGLSISGDFPTPIS